MQAPSRDGKFVMLKKQFVKCFFLNPTNPFRALASNFFHHTTQAPIQQKGTREVIEKQFPWRREKQKMKH